MDLFELNGRVVVNLSDALKAFDEIQENGKKTESKLSKFFSGAGKAAVACGKAIATGLAAGTAAMTGLTVKALNLSGELEQNMGGSEAVFGEYADKVQEKAEDAFESMGLSTSDYLATANKMGALFQGAGFSVEKSMDISSQAMQRAADVASIMGIDTASAMEAVAGAAKGNFTMMDNLGVAMNDTTLQAYALSKGIDKTTSEMTNQEKIGLAMEMFLEKTAYAAGNYKKENETLAGSLGTAKAALTNFLDGSGDVDSLVTALSNAANVIIDNIQTLAPRLITGLTELVSQIVPMIGPLLQQLLPTVIEGAVALVNGLVEAVPEIVKALLNALPGLIQGVMQIIQGIVEALPQILEELLKALPDIIKMICEQLPKLIPMLCDALVQMIVMLCESFDDIIKPIIDALPDIIIALSDGLIENLPALIQGLITLTLAIVKAIPEIIQALVDAIPGVVSDLVVALLESLPLLIQGFIDLAQACADASDKMWQSVWDAFVNFFVGIWDGIKNVFSGIGTWFGEKFTAAKDAVTNAWSSVTSKFTSIKDKIVNAFSSVKTKLSEPFEKARDTIKGIADKIKGFFEGKITLPKIPLPHFSISPKGWKFADLLKGSFPSLGIDWYAKAMDEPMIMNEPTLFGYNPETGRFQGGGEAGSEVVSGTDTLMQMIRSAVATQNETLIYYLQRLIELLAEFFPQILEGLDRPIAWNPYAVADALAMPMNQALGRVSINKERGR